MKSLCRALLVLDVLYCALAVAEDNLPGWHMFESVERIDYEFRDKDGVAIDMRDVLPRGAHVVDGRELADVARFVCEKERDRGPFVFVDRTRGVHAVLDAHAGAAGCKVHGRK